MIAEGRRWYGAALLKHNWSPSGVYSTYQHCSGANPMCGLKGFSLDFVLNKEVVVAVAEVRITLSPTIVSTIAPFEET